MKSALASLSDLLALTARDREFTRREQLSVVMAGHLGIFAGAFLIEWAFQLSSGLPVGFVIGEIAILIAATPFVVRLPWLQDFFRLPEGSPEEPEDPSDKSTRRDTVKKEKRAGAVLIGASVVQFAALASLLWGTGGPLESPFAEMTLMIAVFTPFIANRPKTVGFVVAASIVYYAVLILLYTNAYPKPDTVEEFRKTLTVDDPSVWAYFWVNVMILMGATAFTIFESLVRGGARRRPAGGQVIGETADGTAEGGGDDEPLAPAEA
jgi:hypothetical protein